MFERLKTLINENKDSANPGWRLLFFIKTLIWRCYVKSRAFILWPYYHSKYASILRELIKDQKILILGSGPSAEELNGIPEDVKVFTCNRGMKLLIDKKINRKIDLFFSCKFAMVSRYPDIGELLSKVKTNIFLADDLLYVKKRKDLDGAYARLIFDDGMHYYYPARLIRPYRMRQIMGRSYAPWTSSGIRLLQYALYYGAKEIYLIGIDLGNKGYFWGEREKYDEWRHTDIDENFVKVMSERYDNIYSLSKTSPLTRYIKYRDASHAEPGPVPAGKQGSIK